MAVESFETGLEDGLPYVFGLETRLRHELARDHLPDQRGAPREDTNVAHSRNDLNDVFNAERLHLVSADVDDIISPARRRSNDLRLVQSNHRSEASQPLVDPTPEDDPAPIMAFADRT